MCIKNLKSKKGQPSETKPPEQINNELETSHDFAFDSFVIATVVILAIRIAAVLHLVFSSLNDKENIGNAQSSDVLVNLSNSQKFLTLVCLIIFLVALFVLLRYSKHSEIKAGKKVVYVVVTGVLDLIVESLCTFFPDKLLFLLWGFYILWFLISCMYIFSYYRSEEQSHETNNKPKKSNGGWAFWAFPGFMLVILIIGIIGVVALTGVVGQPYFLISLFSVAGLIGLMGVSYWIWVVYKEENDQKEREKFENDLKKLSGTGTDTQQYNYLGHLQLNWSQLRGYYDISKKQANSSFVWAIVCFFVGIAIIASTVVVPIWVAFSNNGEFKDYNSVIAIVGAVSGAITEFFAATIMLVYKRSLEQLNFYHDALAHYQTYLSCVNLASQISGSTDKDGVVREIINYEFEYAMKYLKVKSKNNKSKEDESENNKSKDKKDKDDE